MKIFNSKVLSDEEMDRLGFTNHHPGTWYRSVPIFLAGEPCSIDIITSIATDDHHISRIFALDKIVNTEYPLTDDNTVSRIVQREINAEIAELKELGIMLED